MISLEKQDIKYTLHYISNCNMCGAPANEAKVLGKRMNCSQGKSPAQKIGITTSILKCKSCNLIFPNPLPIPESINDHYNVPPKDYWVDEYFEVDENYFKYAIDQAKKLLPNGNIKSLDIGAGLGKSMIAMSRAGFDCYGIEPSESFYSASLEKLKIPEDKLMNESIESAEFPENYFDFITFGAVLEHLYDPDQAINKAIQWLKKGGIIHIEVPSSDWLINSLINKFYKLKGLDYVANLSPMHPPYHIYEFSLQSFEENAKKNHFEIADYTYYTCQTYAPRIIDAALKKIMSKTNKGMQLEVWLKKL